MRSSIKLYHIVHINNLSSIISDGYLFSDSEMIKQSKKVVTIGMSKIKERRLNRSLQSYPGLHVGECVPFYFCPRSVMLYVIHRSNSLDINYHGGQGAIIHLVSDFYDTVNWAERYGLRWAFTTSNAGASYFNDYSDFNDLSNINWHAVQSNQWSNPEIKEKSNQNF